MGLQVWLPLNKDPNMAPEITSYKKESGVTLTEDADGWYKVQDTTHASGGRWGIYYDVIVKPNTTYTLYVYSKSTTDTKASIGIQSFVGTAAWPAVRDTNQSSTEKLTTYSWTTGSGDSIVRLYLALVTTATKANDYVFYKEPKVYEHPRSQGILNNEILNTNWSLSDYGKLGKCIKTLGTAPIDTGVSASEWNINETSVSMCGWFKFPFNEIKAQTEQYTFTDVRTTVQGNLLGYNNYAGIALAFNSNNMHQSNGIFSNLYVYSSIRKGSSLIRNSGYTVPFDTWIHLTAVFDRNSKKTYTYVNGLLYSQSSVSYDFTDITATQNFFINVGAVDGGNGPGMNIPFYCNDVRLYNHALTEREVKEIAQGLIVHYPLNNNGLGNENLISETDFNNISKKYTVTSGTEGGFTFTPTESIIANTNYIVSCRLRGNANMNLYKLCTGGNEAINWVNRNQLSTTEYKPFSITFTYPSSKTLNQIYICTRYGSANTQVGDWFEIEPYSLKLEKGNIATSWCPNVSDVLYTKMGMNNNIVYDISGFNNNGRVVGSSNISNDTLRYQASTYIPQTTLIEHLRALSNTDQEWTCCAWVKLDSTVSGQSLNNFNHNNRIVHSNNGTPLLYLNSGDNDYYIYGSKSVNANEWIHIAFVFKNSTGLRNIYINGVLTNSSGPNKTSTPSGIPDTVMIGSGNFAGYMSDYREYATALSAANIQELYEMGVSV